MSHESKGTVLIGVFIVGRRKNFCNKIAEKINKIEKYKMYGRPSRLVTTSCIFVPEMPKNRVLTRKIEFAIPKNPAIIRVAF